MDGVGLAGGMVGGGGSGGVFGIGGGLLEPRESVGVVLDIGEVVGLEVGEKGGRGRVEVRDGGLG